MTPSPLVEALGWVATATFAGSYLMRRAETLVRVQLAGALLWVAYGFLVGAAPVVAANLLVFAAAAWKARAAARDGVPRAQALPPAGGA